MKEDFLSGEWAGYYTYGEMYGESLKNLRIKFDIKFLLKGNKFTGTCQDEDTVKLFDTPANINGFIKDNTICFIKQYPYSYSIHEDGHLTGDKSKRHAPINYSGEFDMKTLSYSGIWEMEYLELIDSNQTVKHIFSGNWFMKKNQ